MIIIQKGEKAFFYVNKFVYYAQHDLLIDAGDCSCSSFVNNLKRGNCMHNATEKRKCYVNQPTTCTDLKKSIQYKGLMFSHQACEKRAS